MILLASGGGGFTRTPKSFDSVKIRENLGKICENLRKKWRSTFAE